MSELLLKLPLDTKGTSPDNLVEGESHALNGRRVRAILPDYGLYFVKSMQVVDTNTGKTLTPGVQWRAGELQVDLVPKYGKSIARVVLITDETLNGPIELTYQALGGTGSVSKVAFLAKVAELDFSGDPIDYRTVIGLPEVFTPLPHKQHSSTVFGASMITGALKSLAAAIQAGNKGAVDELYAYIDGTVGAASLLSGKGATGVLADHLAAQNPHPLFALATDVSSMLAVVRKPSNLIPPAGDTNTALETPLTGYTYQSLYGVAQKAAQFQLSLNPDMSAPIYDRTLGAVVTFQPDAFLTSNTVYYWRCRYQDNDGVWSAWSDTSTFNTANIQIAKPTLTSPVPGAQTNTETPTLTANPFVIMGSTDTQASADWEVWTGPNGTGTRVWSSLNDLVNKLTINVAPGIMVQNATYYARTRQKGAKYGYSAWSDDVMFIAKWDPRPTVLGQVFGGGYYAGDFVMGATTYAVIVAPASYELSGNLTNNNNQTTNSSADDSVSDTTALTVGNATGSAGFIVGNVKALTIGGFNDWQVPSLNVLKLIWNNLRPSLATAPAQYKTGGAEAFTESYYWTSTANNYTTTYQDPATPNYGNVTTVTGPYSASGTYFPGSNGTTPPASCSSGSVINVSHGYFFTVIGGQTASINSTTWSCQSTTYGIVSYTPGAIHTVYHYEAKTKTMSSAGTESTAVKASGGATRCRPVRLVRVA